MIKITINKFFKQKKTHVNNLIFIISNYCLNNKMTTQKKNCTKNEYKKKLNNCELFFFIEFFLYLQYFLIRCTNSF